MGLPDGARGEHSLVRMGEDVDAPANPIAVPLKPAAALFISNLTAEHRKEADYVENRKTPTLMVLSGGEKTPWEEWEAKSLGRNRPRSARGLTLLLVEGCAIINISAEHKCLDAV